MEQILELKACRKSVFFRVYHLLTKVTQTGFNEHEERATNETFLLFLLLRFIITLTHVNNGQVNACTSLGV